MPDLQLALRIRADLRQAVQQLNRLERELRDTGGAAQATGKQATGAARGVDRLGNEAGQATRRLDRMDRSAAGVTRRLGGLYLALGGIGAAAALRGLVEAGLEIEALEQRFAFASGSIAAGAQDLQFVRREADRLGIAFGAAAQGYSSLAAAARGTNVTGAETREIFLGVTEAAAVLRLSSAEVEGALRAVEQIMSKGTLQAEEIRGQLGERIPGAFQIAARAMGVTTAELNKMLELGQVASDEFLPRFGAQLRKEFAEGVPDAADSASASFARLGNAIERLQQSVAKSGLLDWLVRVTDRLTDAVDKAERLGPALDAILLGGERDTSGPSGIVAEIEALARSDPAAAEARLAELESTAQAASRRVTELSAELRALGEPGPIDIDFFDRRKLETQLGLARSVFQSVIEQLSAARAAVSAADLARLGEAVRSLSAAPAASPAASPADAGAEAREKAEERANAAIEQLRTGHEDRLARIGLDAAQRIERDRIEALRRIDELEAEGGDPEAAAEARLAADRRYFRELEQLQLGQLRKAVEAEDRKAAAAAGARRDALDDLAAIERGLLGPYERAVAEVEAWRDATVAAFEEAGLSAGEYGEAVGRAVSERLAEAAEEEADRRLRASQNWRDGAVRALQDYAAEAADAGQAAEDAVTGGLRSMEDALVEFVRTGKLSFSSLVDSIVADLARIAIRQSITGPLATALGSLFSGGGGGVDFTGGHEAIGVGHSGGIAGQFARQRYGVPPGIFAGAPRYHRGGIAGALRSDEVPAILRKGETVRTPAQERALAMWPAELEINIENTGTPQRYRAERTFSPLDRRQIVNIVAEDMAEGGDTARAAQGRFGLARPAAS